MQTKKKYENFQAQVRELQTRLKERDEEISDLQDNITSLRRGEPYLDVSLPLNEDPDKVLNISMTGRVNLFLVYIPLCVF